MWTNIDALNVPEGTLIFCEGITERVGVVRTKNLRVIEFMNGTKCGMSPSLRIYVPKSQEMKEHLLKLEDMFTSGDQDNYNLALMVLESVTSE